MKINLYYILLIIVLILFIIIYEYHSTLDQIGAGKSTRHLGSERRFISHETLKDINEVPDDDDDLNLNSNDDNDNIENNDKDINNKYIRTENNFKKLKIAVAITVTKDGDYLDGAAVLQHSFRLTKSRHDVDYVAIVHKDVKTTRDALASLGFIIHEYEQPIFSSEIQGKHLRETIDKSGCCGALELLKLRAYQLIQYDKVLLMDMDAIIVKNIDFLFEDVSKGKTLLYTQDIAMDNPGSLKPPVQGGFLLMTPSLKVYEEIVDIFRVGDFRPGTGWGGMKIGW